MARVTVQFDGVTPNELRKILLAHSHEFEMGHQPEHIAASYIREHDRAVGCFVRAEGLDFFTVTTLPMYPVSARMVVDAAVVDA